MVVPMTRASANPMTARVRVVVMADQKRSVPSIPPRVWRVSAGAGST